MSQINLSPIVLFAYNRPWHTEQVLRALQMNVLADQSRLIVYVDGPKANATQQQIEQIKEVRNLVKSNDWCKAVEIHIAEENIGCRNSIIQGITEVLNSYNSVIVLEDDIVTSPYFLQFMNSALQYYENRKSVYSISGYNFPENKLPIPSDYDYDVYVSLRLLNWGWGTWKDRWEQISWDKSFVPDFLRKTNQIEAFNRGGDDLSKMLLEEYEQKSDSWDIQFAYTHFMNHAVSIIPCYSYTNNIGLDESGTHTINQSELTFENNLLLCIENPCFIDVLYEDKRISNAFYSVYYPRKRSILKKFINRLNRILGGKNVFVIKKKIYV